MAKKDKTTSTGKKKLDPSKIMPCKCKHEYQDQKYNGNRLFILQNASDKYQCSVCNFEKSS